LLPDFYSGATGLSGCFTRDFLSCALTLAVDTRPAVEQRGAAVSLNGVRILVVDDNKSNRLMVKISNGAEIGVIGQN